MNLNTSIFAKYLLFVVEAVVTVLVKIPHDVLAVTLGQMYHVVIAKTQNFMRNSKHTVKSQRSRLRTHACLGGGSPGRTYCMAQIIRRHRVANADAQCLARALLLFETSLSTGIDFLFLTFFFY